MTTIAKHPTSIDDSTPLQPMWRRLVSVFGKGTKPGGTEPFAQAVTKAEKFALYALRHGINVPDDVLEDILGAQKKGSSSSMERAGARAVLALRASGSAESRLGRVGDVYNLEVSRQTFLDSAKATLEAINRYVLPLLYGLLGAAAYIMRTLSKEIEEISFTRISNIRFSLRMVLGMLAGISIGLVFEPGRGSAQIDVMPLQVTPLALAFLAGYSVELLFSAMDRLLAAFSSNGKATGQDRVKQPREAAK